MYKKILLSEALFTNQTLNSQCKQIKCNFKDSLLWACWIVFNFCSTISELHFVSAEKSCDGISQEDSLNSYRIPLWGLKNSVIIACGKKEVWMHRKQRCQITSTLKSIRLFCGSRWLSQTVVTKLGSVKQVVENKCLGDQMREHGRAHKTIPRMIWERSETAWIHLRVPIRCSLNHSLSFCARPGICTIVRSKRDTVLEISRIVNRHDFRFLHQILRHLVCVRVKSFTTSTCTRQNDCCARRVDQTKLSF